MKKSPRNNSDFNTSTFLSYLTILRIQLVKERTIMKAFLDCSLASPQRTSY